MKSVAISKARFNELNLGCNKESCVHFKQGDCYGCNSYEIAYLCLDDKRLKQEMSEEEYDAYIGNTLKVVGKLTEQEVGEIFSNNIIPDEIEIGSGITEFYIADRISIGICYEYVEDTTTAYTFNIFLDDEYINVSGSYSNIYDAVKEVTAAYNRTYELIEKNC